MDGLIQYPELNSILFTRENYEPDWCEALGIDYDDSMNIPCLFAKINEYIIGYCDAVRLSFRPKENTYAVMFEKDGKHYWFHLKKAFFEMLLENEQK